MSVGSVGKIYSYPNNPRVAKTLIAAKYNGAAVEVVDINVGVDNKAPAFLKKFPLGKVPCFEGTDGFCLYESNAIARYVASLSDKTTLLGASKKEAGLIAQFVALSDNEFNPIAATWLYPILGYSVPTSADLVASAKEKVLRVLAVLDAYLLNQTFLVGESVTLADISLACALAPFFKLVFDSEFRSAFKNVVRWFVTCVNQPHFKSVLGEIALCEKMQVAKKAAAPVKEKKEKKAKAAKPAAEEDEEMDATELALAEEKPKEKNPLDLLPKSPLVLDAWKRFYSNNETRPDACDWFWANYDAEGYSIWRCDYKYNDELKMTFMSSNLVGGFFQRLESARKYAFGSLCILGEDNKNSIAGYFVFRGTEIPFEVRDSADYDSYAFTRADAVADKEKFNAFIAWDETIEGKKMCDGKIFK